MPDKVPDLTEKAREQGKQAVHGAANKADQVIDKAANAAHQASNQGGQGGQGLAAQASDKAQAAYDAAKGYASQAADSVTGYGSQAAGKADDYARAAGDRLSGLADTVRARAPHEGYLGGAAEAVAGGLERGGDYLSQRGLSGVGGDLTDMVRKHPLPALLIGVGIGYLVGMATSSSRRSY